MLLSVCAWMVLVLLILLPEGRAFSGIKLFLTMAFFALAAASVWLSLQRFKQARAVSAANERRFLAEAVAMRHARRGASNVDDR